MLRVVLNADDLGLSDTVNDAVFEALERGWCTAASLLATGPASADALRRARAAGIAVGVHLALTEVPAVLRTALAPGGRFRVDPLRVRREDAEAVYAEWVAQVARVRDAGVVVDHLDSHQHVHHQPVLADVIARVAGTTGIRHVRGMGALRARSAGTLPGRALQPLRAWRYRRRLRGAGLRTTDGFAPVGVFLEHGKRHGWGTVELMAHPGNPHHARYAEEMAAIAGGALERLGFPIVRIGWGAVE